MGIGLALESLSSLESPRGRHEQAMRLLGSAQKVGRITTGGSRCGPKGDPRRQASFWPGQPV